MSSSALKPMATAQEAAQQVYESLRLSAASLSNSEIFARMLAGQVSGVGAMPERLGLTVKQFGALMGLHFPGVDPVLYDCGPELDLERAQEREELRKLFLIHCPSATAEQVWVADMLAAGCMGGNHLWQDLGLWSRKDVTLLMENNFPVLKARNDRDMKWKKFFYKQLCNQEGIYICRSPSCEVCDDFKSCFGPEEGQTAAVSV